MNKTTSKRTSQVISLSLAPKTFARLERARKKFSQSRSALVSRLIEGYIEDERWQRIYERGKKTALKFGITSEEDIDRILHEA